MQDIETISQKTHDVVMDVLPMATREELSDNNLFNLGLDSVSAITLVLSLEDTFSVKLEQSDISVENFSTIGDIVKLIKRKEEM